MAQAHVHIWQDTGIGTAPFRLVGAFTMPSPPSDGGSVAGYQNAMTEACQCAQGFGVSMGSCDVCGTGIHNHFVIQDADGKRFVCGCECVRKTDDSKLVSEVEAAERKRKIADRAAKREAARQQRIAEINAELERQRQANGGLTDAEVAEQKLAKELRELAIRMYEVNGWLIDVLNKERSSDFTNAMIDKLHEHLCRDLSDRCVGILRDIYARHHGRRGSKKYVAAETVFDAKVEG